MGLFSEDELKIYEWQLDLPGFGREGQERLKNATALVSRVGGLGGAVCYSLAAAGIGRMILAHAGPLRANDLNRQILMTHAHVGLPRVTRAAQRLRDLNPYVEVEAHDCNITTENARDLVGRSDIVFDCAPIFPERFAMNRACVELGKPMIEAAVFGMEGQVTTVLPQRSPCLACLYPEDPPAWKRRFPVLGAVSALAAAIAATEGVKVLTGLGETLAGTLLYFNAATMSFRRIPIARRPDCAVCGHGS